VLYANLRSLKNKLHDVETLLQETEPRLAVFTESWACDKQTNANLNLSGYEIVSRNDRRTTKSGKGGGVVIYADNDIAKIVENIDTGLNDYDFQVCRIKIKHVTVIAVYRSPNTSSEHDTILVNYLYTIPDNCLILGDFNLPKINWENLAAAHN
jgi:hypothetical protein